MAPFASHSLFRTLPALGLFVLAACQHALPPVHNATDSAIRVVVTAPPHSHWATLGLQSAPVLNSEAAVIEPGVTTSSASWAQRKAASMNDRVGYRVEVSSIVSNERKLQELWIDATEFRGNMAWSVRRVADGFTITRD